MNSSISVDLKTGIFQPVIMNIRVRSENGQVLLLIRDKVVKFTTIAAHRAGFDLVKKSAEALPKEFINLKINNHSTNLLPEHATKVGTALLRKADDADDFQLRAR